MTPRCPGRHPKGALANPRAGEGHRAAACSHRLGPPSRGGAPTAAPRGPPAQPAPTGSGTALGVRGARAWRTAFPARDPQALPPRQPRALPRGTRPGAARAPLTATTGPLSAPPLSCRRGDTGHPTPDTGPLAAEPAGRRSAGPPPAGRPREGRPRAGRPSRLPPPARAGPGRPGRGAPRARRARPRRGPRASPEGLPPARCQPPSPPAPAAAGASLRAPRGPGGVRPGVPAGWGPGPGALLSSAGGACAPVSPSSLFFFC